MYPTNSVGPMAATGIGTASLGAATFTSGWASVVFYTFLFIAAFTLLGVVGALGRIMPAVSVLYRTPEKKAPTRSELTKTASRSNGGRHRR